jgi:hypothetical protein
MNPLLQSERIQSLLREAEDAQRLLDRLGDARPDVREVLAGIHRDLGQAVHVAWRDMIGASKPPSGGSASDAEATVAPVEEPPVRRIASDDFAFGPGPDDVTGETPVQRVITDVPDTTDVPEGTDPALGKVEPETWYTDEVEWDGQAAPLFAPGELADASNDEIPESEAADPPSDASGDVPVDAPPGMQPAAASPTPLPDDLLEIEPIPLSSDMFPAAEPAPLERPAWLDALGELTELLHGQADPADAAALAVEASRVQWATTGMEQKWAEFPASVRQALLGLLAARSRALQESLEVDVGPRLALDRLRRYRKASGLPPVVGLLPDRGAESGSWSEDAKRWWTVLSEGLRASTPGGSNS